MQCPFCKFEDTRVVDSRLTEEGVVVRRRRECTNCSQRFTTFEKAQLSLPQVLKRDGTPEPFSEDKLRRGIDAACYKRPVTPAQVDSLVDQVIRELRAGGEREVPSRHIGELVMQQLGEIDHVAYVRFASIYRRFADANAFREEVERLLAAPTAEQRRAQLSLIQSEAPRGGRHKSG